MFRNAIVVPAPAIQRGPQATFVYVVTEKGTVEARNVTVSMSQNDESVVASGVSPGDVVVTDGVDRLQPGSHVSVTLTDGPTRKAAS
jgi:membrane fusion protein, multidrug efflux system